jgi:Xaa-Pro aminopeptidase
MSQFCPYTYSASPPRLEYPWKPPMPSEKERDRRWQAIRSAMTRHSIDCLIVGAPWGFMPTQNNHLYYISNYIPFSNVGLFVVFPAKGEPQLEVSNAIGPQFLHTALQTSWIRNVVDSLYPAQEIINKIKQLKLENGRLGIIGYKMGVFPAVIYDALREGLPDAKFEDATSVLAEAMDEVTRTSEEEPVLLKKACEILDLSFKAVAAALKPGVTENELWAAAEQAIIKNGGWYGHFILGTSGPNPTFPKAPAAYNSLQKGDVFIFELHAIYSGVAPQSCFALSLGRPKREVEQMFELCEELYNFSLLELAKNRTFLDIELDLAKRIHEAGYEPMTPQIHVYNMSIRTPMNSVPQPGDYFTVHPNMCNKDFSAGAKFGDVVRIIKGGKVERLLSTPARLNIIDVS